MGKIVVKMLGIPGVFLEERAVVFPFRKVEALFYYLAVNRQAVREELTELLWGSLEESLARKNLRNALYQLKKLFNGKLLSSRKSIISIDSEIEIVCDIDNLKNDNLKTVEDLDDQFLQGFNLREGEGFEEWVVKQREYYKALYIKKLHARLREALGRREYELAEKCALKLVKADEFDEKAYRILMKLYCDTGAFNRAIDVYKELVQILDSELGVAPEAETRRLFCKVMDMRGASEPEVKEIRESFFYGRDREIKILKENFEGFDGVQGTVPFIITGEAGIGKSRLKEEFTKRIDANNIYLLEAACYQAEEEFFLRPWNSIFEKIKNILINEKIQLPPQWGDLASYFFPAFADLKSMNALNPNKRADEIKYQAVEQVIAGILQLLSKKRKIILVFEDMQWMDNMSLSLLNNLMLHLKNITFIGTTRMGYDRKLDKFIYSLKRYNNLKIIELQRFSREETNEFINCALSNNNLPEKLKNKIFKETEGNTFFLVECLKTIKENGNIEDMTPAVRDIIKSRFLDISEEGKKLLDIASIFFDEVPMYILKELSGKDELDMMDTIEELQEKLIFKEVSGNRIAFRFTHQKLRDYVYSMQSSIKRRILHDKVGKILEGELRDDRRDILIYPRLIYHFSNSGNKLLELKYSIKNLKYFLDESHELFPVIRGEFSEEKYLHLNNAKTIETLSCFEQMINSIIKEEGATLELTGLEVEILHMIGRYLIREGEYERGIEYIKSMIDKASRTGDYYNVLRGCRQMIYYSIQVHNVQVMQEYVEKGLYIADKYDFIEEKAILLRLDGLNKIMLGKYERAEELLEESIEMLDNHNTAEDVYFLNIAAAYNYLGDAKKYAEDFNSAFYYYNKAIKICEDKGISTGLTVFYTNAGQILFNIGNHKKSGEFLKKSLEIYNTTELLWGRAIAEAYMSLIYIQEEEYENALKSLERSEIYSGKIMNPYEMGIVYMVKAKISHKMNDNYGIRKTFKDNLSDETSFYRNKSLEYLKNIDSYLCREI